MITKQHQNDDLLNIVNNNDEIIGTADRKEVHRLGLLHREIHVYFVTPNHEIIFQHRAKDKDTFPDLLDATVGGHVDIGYNYEETAIKETLEETGIKINKDDLILINKIQKGTKDQITNKINNVFNTRYLYIYRGKIADLKIELGKAIGFEVWSIAKIMNITPKERTKFIPYIIDFAINDLIEFISRLKL